LTAQKDKPDNIKFPEFINFLFRRLKKPLPGRSAHLLMAPSAKNKPFRTFTPKKDSKSAAVLVLLSPNKISEDFKLLLTLRSNNIRHSGQFSYPGGISESNEKPEKTALREAFEEVGLDSSEITIIGTLSKLYVSPSDSLITPVVGYVQEMKELHKNSKEVQEILIVELNELLHEKNLKHEIWDFKGKKVEVPFWNINHETPLWGATAMITAELLELYKEFLNKNN
jgi:8-oxo-dGTP pyrophosphatase MutT (NUDIX family)